MLTDLHQADAKKSNKKDDDNNDGGVVLASQSPRRLEIMTDNLGFTLNTNLRVIPSAYEEDLDKSQYGSQEGAAYGYELYPMHTSFHKAKSVMDSLMAEKQRIPKVILGVDTIVLHENKILEKPKSEEEAFEVLSSMVGSTVSVISGVTLLVPTTSTTEAKSIQFHVTTLVKFFSDIPDSVIHGYIATREPFDKAGGFGIQGLGSSLIESIEGCYFNVMGLPIVVARHLREILLG